MARRLIGSARSATPGVVLLAGALAFLPGGCASTDELYAVYDEQQCRIEVEPATIASALPAQFDEATTLRELIGTSYFPWEPAVYFDFNSWVLDTTNGELLAGAIDVLTRFPDLKVGLQGFTDRLGSTSYNAYLASRRVRHVYERLIAAGVNAAQLVSQPIGEGLPTYLDDDEAARAVNRRVELMLLDGAGRPLHPLFDFSTYGNERDRFSSPVGEEQVGADGS